MRGAVVAALLLAWALAVWLAQPGPKQVRESGHATARASQPVALLAEEGLEGFARVTGPRAFEFPADHGPHPAYRHEWWYLTGHLHGKDGRRFGFQVTFFRFATTPAPPESDSHWATNQLYMAHFALTDVAGQRFHTAERLSRGALGLAGAEPAPFRVWLDDWQLRGGASLFPLHVALATDDVALELVLSSDKPVVLQGDAGYSRKGRDPGNASHYYAYTRLRATGEVTVAGERVAVRGQSWLDREWGSSALDPQVSGWDWFSLQLDDGRELMFFHLRHADGRVDPLSHGSLVAADGSKRTLALSDVQAAPLRHWTAPDGRRYPVAWQLQLPTEGLDLQLAPVLDAQAWQQGFRYWEGALDVTGTGADGPVSGVGYLEMTGYE